MRPSALTGVHLFHQGPDPAAVPARSSPIRAVLAALNSPLSPLPQYPLSASLLFRSLALVLELMLAYITMLFRTAPDSRSCCVSVNHRNPHADVPAGALSKVLPKYERRAEFQICRGRMTVLHGQRDRRMHRERIAFPTIPYRPKTRPGSREITSAPRKFRCEFRIYTSRHRESLIRAAF